MERRLVCTIFMLLGLFGISGFVKCQSENQSSLSPPPLKLNPPPSPSLETKPLPVPSQPPSPPPPPPPIPPPPPPPPPSPSNFFPPPPPQHSPPPHHPKNRTEKSPHSFQNHRSTHQNNLNHPVVKDRKNNLGKKTGFLFLGIAGLLQLPIIGFLVYKRWQISKIKDRDVNYAS